MRDDVLYETPDVEEAIRRLPQKVADERNFRMIRALQYSGLKKYLPKEQWTKYEEVCNIHNHIQWFSKCFAFITEHRMLNTYSPTCKRLSEKEKKRNLGIRCFNPFMLLKHIVLYKKHC